MVSIIQYLLMQNQYLKSVISNLLQFVCKYIPLKQRIHDDSHSPKYQIFKVDELPLIIKREVWFYKDFIQYIKWRYNYDIKPVKRRSDCDIPDDCVCPYCNAPKEYLYKNNGSHNQIQCKVCGRLSQTDSHPLSSKSFYYVRTALTLLLISRTGNTLLFTSASIPNVRFILTTLKRSIKNSFRNQMVKANTNCTISTGNLPSISLKWIFHLFRKMLLL